MNLLCWLRLHKWNAFNICSRCCRAKHEIGNKGLCRFCGCTEGSIMDWACNSRIINHDWSKDCQKCAICGLVRDNAHNWSGNCEKCSQCGKTKEDTHDWSKDCEKCAKCGTERANSHNWNECECMVCHKDRHKWNGCKCINCGKSRDTHDWSGDCEKCAVCSKTLPDAHMWAACRCLKCGKTRDEDHKWYGCQCLWCGKVRDDEHRWTKNCEKCIFCGKTLDNAHDWSKDCEKCSKCDEKRTKEHVWNNHKCSICGKVCEHDWRKDIYRCSLCGLNRDVVPSLKEGIEVLRVGRAAFSKRNHNVDIRGLENAIKALRQNGGEEAVAGLIESLICENYPSVRYAAARALKSLGDMTSIPELLKIARSIQGDQVCVIIEILGLLGDPIAVPTLLGAYKKDSRFFYWNTCILKALQSIGDMRAKPVFILALTDNDTSVRVEAARALGILNDKLAIPNLLNALNDECEDVQNAAFTSLQRIGPDPSILGMIGGPKAIPRLLRILQAAELKDDKTEYNRISRLLHLIRHPEGGFYYPKETENVVHERPDFNEDLYFTRSWFGKKTPW